MSHDRSHDVSVIGFDVGGREHADLALELAAPPDVVLLGYDGEHVSLTQRQLLVALRLIVVEHNHLRGWGGGSKNDTYINIHVYRIAGKFDGDLNLANWRFWTATAKVYSRQVYELRTVMLPSASHRQI